MRMNPLILAAMLAVLLATLAATTLSYRSAQEMLLREANSLYSGEALSVRGDLAAAVADARRDQLDVRFFRPLSDDGKTRAVLSSTGSLTDLPTHDVSWAVSDARPGALVGAEILAMGIDVGVGDAAYAVAGVLGTDDRSLVADDVLIYDPGLFVDAGPQAFVVDGPDAADLASTLEDVHPTDDGFSRRTNVDYVSPVIVGLSSAVLILGAGLAGHLVFALGRRRDTIEHLWGRSPVAVLGRRLGLSGAVWASAVLLVGVAFALFDPPAQVLSMYLQSGILLLGIFLLAFTMSSVVRKRAA
jgi:hypothetical protein